MTLKLTPEKREKIKKLTLDFMSTIDKTGRNTERYKKKFADMKDADFDQWVNAMDTDIDNFPYVEAVPYLNEPQLEDIKEAAELVNVELHQYVYWKHDGAAADPVRSATKVPVGYIHVRRLQQLLAKKTTHSVSVSSRNVLTGQLSGDDAVGRIADEEAFALMTVDADDVLHEMFALRADDADRRTKMYSAIDRDGYVQGRNIQGDVKNRPGLNYMNVLLLAAGLQTDLVNPTNILRYTVDKKADPRAVE